MIGKGTPQEIIQAVRVINARTERKTLLILAAFLLGGEEEASVSCPWYFPATLP